MKNTNDKGNNGFSSIWGFLLTVIGFAVGVGSMWRFPYVTGTNGGALFILIYVLVIIIIGIPLLTAEIGMGYFTQKTAIKAYTTIAPKKKWFLGGYLHMIVALSVFAYTVPIYVWILSYIYKTATGFFTGLSPDEIAASFDALNTDYKQMFLFAIINWGLIALVVRGGLQSGVEKLNKILLPALAVIMVVCIAIGMTVEGSEAGLKFMFKPDFSQLTFGSITTAVGQAFFAIGIGMLASMVFGSCLKKEEENILKDSTVISGAIVVAGIASGLMIFPMVFAFGLEPSAGAGLTMITLPNVFAYIKGGSIIGCMFYVGFYFAAFSSAIGLCEACTSVIMDQLKISRYKALAIVMGIAVVVGSMSIAIPGFLDAIDIFTSNYLLVISGFIIAIFVGWVWGADNMLDAANIKNKAARCWIKYSVKYICPIAIAVIFLCNFV